MIKMEIRMDNEKILKERKYRLEAVYEAVDNAFKQWNFKGEKTASGSVIYKDNGDDRDLSTGRARDIFQRKGWCRQIVQTFWM